MNNTTSFPCQKPQTRRAVYTPKAMEGQVAISNFNSMCLMVPKVAFLVNLSQ